MFTNQISSILQRLAAAGMPTAEQSAIAELGNCSAPLDHRAPVTIDSTPSMKRQSPDGAPDWGISQITPGNIPYATLRVANWDSRLNGNVVEGGLGMIVDGGLYADFFIGPDGSPVVDDSIEVDAIVDIRYDSATHSFQIKTRTVRAPPDSVESDWTTFHSAALLEKVVREANYNVDVTDTFVNKYTEDVYALEVGAQATDNVFDTESCVPGSGVQVLDGAGAISPDADLVEMDTTGGTFDGTLPAFSSTVTSKHVLGTGTAGVNGKVVPDGGTINGGPEISIADNELWLFFIGSTEWKAKRLG